MKHHAHDLASDPELIGHLRAFLNKNQPAAATAARDFPGSDQPGGVDLAGLLRHHLDRADSYGEILDSPTGSKKPLARGQSPVVLACDESRRFDRLQWASEDFYYFGSPRDEGFAAEAGEAYRDAWEEAIRKLHRDLLAAWQSLECASPCHKKWGEEDEAPRPGEEEFERELRARLRRFRRETQTPELRLRLLILEQLASLVVAPVQRVGRLVYRASLRARLSAIIYCDRDGPADPPPPAL